MITLLEVAVAVAAAVQVGVGEAREGNVPGGGGRGVLDRLPAGRQATTVLPPPRQGWPWRGQLLVFENFESQI